MNWKLSVEQWQAVSKRIVDALEKLSIGCFLYWVFQERVGGLVLAITLKDAQK